MDITLELIYNKLLELTEKRVSAHESEQTNEINAALAKAQIEYPLICLNRKDSYLNNSYTDLDNIMRFIRPILGKNEISVTQRTLTPEDGRTFIQTRIWHSSGQWIQSVERFKPSENDIDSYNSEMNEIKKSQIMALLNITISNDIYDDNGYSVMKNRFDGYSSPIDEASMYKPGKESYESINKDDVKKIKLELSFIPGLEGRLLKDLHVRSLADIPKSQFDNVLEVVRKNKEAYRSK